MLKIVPDPPHQFHDSEHTLEDLLVQAAQSPVCALTVAQQAVLLHPKPAGQMLTLAFMHEIESARGLVEIASSRVQVRH